MVELRLLIAFKLRVYFSFVLYVVAPSNNSSTETNRCRLYTHHSYTFSAVKFYECLMPVYCKWDSAIRKKLQHIMKVYRGTEVWFQSFLTGALGGGER
jgi:hypothetical protein